MNTFFDEQNADSSSLHLDSGAKNRYDLRILRSLRQIIQAVDVYSRKLSTRYDITAPQLIALLLVAEQGPLSIARISKEVHLSPSTLIGVIDRLESKDYVQRTRSAQDRRQVLICITDSGAQFAKASPSPLQETLASGLEKLSDLEQVSISLSLERVVELMQAENIQAAPLLHSGSDLKLSIEGEDEETQNKNSSI